MSVSAPTYIYPPVTIDPGSLYDEFVAFMQANIPNWQPYSGELDDWLARAFTAIGAQLGEIESDVATSIFRYFGAYMMGYPPYDATAAYGTVTITVKDDLGYTIPAFTALSFPDASGQLQGFETLAEVDVPAGQTSITVTVQAMNAGSAANGCSGNGDLDSSMPITFITGLSMAASSNGGTDAEDDAAYLDRLTQLMTTVTPSPVTTQDFTVIAQTQPGVGRAFTLPTFNPANWTTTGTTAAGNAAITAIPSTANIPVGAPVSGGSIPAGAFVKSVDSATQITLSAAPTAAATGVTLTITGQSNQGGMVTTWVVDANGEALPDADMATIQATIQDMCLANVVYTVKAPTYTPVDVTANVVAWPSPDNPTATVQAAVEAAITSFLTPGTFGQLGNYTGGAWLNETTVRIAALQTAIMNVSGVHYATVQIDGASNDVPLPGVVPLPQPGTITVNVTQG